MRLLYWPVTEHNSLTITTPLSVDTFGTMLTSPTVYISYASLYASDSCSAIGTTHGPTIVALPETNQLSSLWAAYPEPIPYTASFNFTDLITPIPKSIYDRQPRCASYSGSRAQDPQEEMLCMQGNCTINCPSDRPYEPLLVVPSQLLQSIDPLWASCSADVRGQYDPPHILDPAAYAAAPTTSSMSLALDNSPLPAPATSVQPSTAPKTDKPSAQPPAKPSKPPAVGDPGVPDTAAGSAEGVTPGDGHAQDLNSDPSGSDGGSDDTRSGRQHPEGTSAQPSNGGGKAQIADVGAAGSTKPDPNQNAAGRIASAIGSDPSKTSEQEDGHRPVDEVATPDASHDAAIPQHQHESHVSDDKEESQTHVPGSPDVASHPGGNDLGEGTSGNDLAVGQASSAGSAGEHIGSFFASMQRPGDTYVSSDRSSDRSHDSIELFTALNDIKHDADPHHSYDILVGGHSLAWGDSIVISGWTVSFGPNGVVVADSTTIPAPPARSGAGLGATITSIGREAIATDPSDPNAIIVGGTYTLHSGQTTIINGTAISFGPNGLAIATSFTAPSPHPSLGSSLKDLKAEITINGRTYTAQDLNGDGGIAVVTGADGIPTTFSMGGSPATIDGKIITLASDGVDIIGQDGGNILSVVAWQTESTSSTTEDREAAFTDSYGRTRTAVETSGATTAVVDGSITLTLGGPASIVGGETLSLGSSGIVLDGSSTATFSTIIETLTADGAPPTATPTATGSGLPFPEETNSGRKGSVFFTSWLLLVHCTFSLYVIV